MDPIRFLLICLAGWMNRNQQQEIEYLREEVRALREHLGPKRLPFTDEQRARLARKAKRIKFGKLKQIASIVTLQTLLVWHRRLVAKKYDSGAKRVDWMKQIARNLTDGIDGFLFGCRYLIDDRAPCFSKEFRRILRDAAVKTIRLPRKSPNLNPFAERWVRTAKELCVDRMIFFGESSLRQALAEVGTFYNRERPHQGVGNTIILPEVDKQPKHGTIECRSRLAGMLNYYHRKAA